ncbi:DUF3613 domain-containing protein [Hydrogenophaga palleronii]|uniref:DUF3613 domain-containing protein n=1 Tax=Hydrogenophaga palleronii TaxID=65655 RepID=UPI0008254C88|nr:DUF3613 domain-containing protein [Hydrogenophaga palleronii]
MTKTSLHPLRCLPLCAALAVATPLWAQTSPEATAPATATEASAAAPEAPAAHVTRVGDATYSLLQRQREGREASATPRPIDGAVAELSQQRYLKSFEQPVPAWFGSHLEKQ